MNLGELLNSSFLAWGVLGVLMIMMVVLAFLRRNQKIKEQTGILIIAVVLLLVLIALSIGEN